MKAEQFFYICFILLLFVAAWLILRREKCKRKIRHMGEEEKTRRLNALAKPFGFLYDPMQDIFLSDLDAWQRGEGYGALFDRLASKFNMVIDAMPVYFDYQGKTWLLEFWKGQYGINAGAEVGIYHTNRIVPSHQRRLVHYNAVSNHEMPLIGFCLERRGHKLFTIKKYHWWLAAFRMGCFVQPKDLVLYATVTFHDEVQAQAFSEGLREAGYSENKYRLRGRRVSLVWDETQKHRGWSRLQRGFAQKQNRFFCSLYRIVTRPFVKTSDRMLFLYEQLPWCFRHMMRLHFFAKKVRVKL